MRRMSVTVECQYCEADLDVDEDGRVDDCDCEDAVADAEYELRKLRIAMATRMGARAADETTAPESRRLAMFEAIKWAAKLHIYA